MIVVKDDRIVCSGDGVELIDDVLKIISDLINPDAFINRLMDTYSFRNSIIESDIPLDKLWEMFFDLSIARS